MLPNTSKVYVGVDPALRKSGLVILGPGGCQTHLLQPPKEMRATERLIWHRGQLNQLVPRETSHLCIEGPALYSVNRHEDIGQLHGIYLVLFADLDIPVTVVPPKSLKKFATGSGGAPKEKMIAAAEKKWPGVAFQEDTADAAWLAAIACAIGENDATPLTRYQIESLAGIRKNCKAKPYSPKFELTNI